MTSGDLQAMNELARGGGRFAMRLYHHFVPIAAQSKAYDPAGAISAGFLDRIVPRGKAEAVALETACELAKLPSAAYAQNKLARRARSLENMASDLEA